MAAEPAAAAVPSGQPVVFIGPADAHLDEALRDAVSAQLSGALTPILFGRFERDDQELLQCVERAKAFMVAHRALGVFWVDARVHGDWLVYLLADASGTRVLVRHIAVEADGDAAATEAVAVITRESSEGLRTGQAPPMNPVSLTAAVEPTPFEAPKPPPPPKPVPRPLGAFEGVSLYAGYHGDAFSGDVGWQSGARLAVTYRLKRGAYAALGYTFFRDAGVSLTAPDLTFRLQRSPFDLALGYAHPFGRFVPALEVRALVELLNVGSLSAPTGFEATSPDTRALAYLGPRARFDVALSRTLSLGIAVGVDVALNRFSFITRGDNGERTLLEPSGARPVIEAGVSLWP